MATDMLLAAGNHRTAPDRTSPDGARPRGGSGPVSPGLGAIVAREVVPRLRAAFDGAAISDSRLITLAQDTSLAQDISLAQDTSLLRGEAARGTVARGVDADQIEALVDQLLRADLEGACDRIDAGRACGRSLGQIYVELLMPAALRLARLLADDLCGSTQATLAFCNLQLILRRYADAFRDGGRAPSGMRALLATTPLGVTEGAGLQVFGLLFAAEFFRRDGWDVWTERSLGSDAFREVVLREWFDLVEVLATESSDLDAVASGIRQIRRAAPNPRVAVVACGQVFAKHPEYVRMIGADRSVSDPLASLPDVKEFIAGPSQRRRLS